LILSDGFAVLQASILDSFCFNPFSAFQNGLGSTKVDIGRRYIAEALVVTFVIVMLDEVFNLAFKVAPLSAFATQLPAEQWVGSSFLAK